LVAGQHRLLLDTTTADAFGSALLYANNFLTASQTGYGLKDPDSAIVIVVRHFATVLKRGVHLAVCQLATRLFAAGLAQASGGNADAVYNEVVGNLVANSHMVPAGIVAVSRGQERGYTFASVG
jgi:intracellular sulfur oxidation DsrE/DsrF family protein